MTHLLEWPKSRALTTPNAGEDVEQQELSFVAGGNAKRCSHLGGFLVVSHKTKYTLTIGFSNHAPCYLPKEVENSCPHKNLHTDVYSSCIHSCPNPETTRMPFSR